MTEIFADVYVNPANSELKHTGGLAKAIVDKAGYEIQLTCNKHVEKNKLNEGDVFATSSGQMGIKYNGEIFHAVGPIWRNGSNRESFKLRSTVSKCLNMANDKNASSIAIPPISTGIFNYPLKDALEIITNAVLDFLKTTKNCNLKKIIFISNLEDSINEWFNIMYSTATTNDIKILNLTGTEKTSFKWYWKDDQNLWKAYLKEYSKIIQKNYQEKKLQFEMLIEGKKYEIDLRNPNSFKQTNIQTKHTHSVTNTQPLELKYSWFWTDDKDRTSPYSEEHSKLIENYYLSGKEFIVLNICRHLDDKVNQYKIEFTRNDKEQHGIQTNLSTKTSVKRKVTRTENMFPAKIEENNDADEISSLATKLLFYCCSKNEEQNMRQMLDTLIENAYVTDSVPKIHISSNELKKLESKFDAKITTLGNKFAIKALKDKIDKVKSELLLFALNDSPKIKYPSNWDPFNNTGNLLIKDIPSNSEEYQKIYEKISKTMPNPQVIKIERIQNKWLWKMYNTQKKILSDKGVPENVVHLFHGTRNNDPKNIYNDQIGFDMRYSGSGMWGIGIYFAVNASYSYSGYSFKNPDGTKSLFCARVALGDCVQLPSNSSLRIPPVNEKTQHRIINSKM